MERLGDLPRALRAHGLGAAVVTMVVLLAGAVVTLAAGSVDPLRNLAVALVLGVLLGAGYAVAQAGRDQPHRLDSPGAIEERYGVPVFSVTASERLAHGAGRRFGSASSDHLDPEALVSEEFRRLRDHLVARTDTSVGVLAVTSLHSGNGTSTVALGLAVTYAASGQRVILVDADLQHPGVAHALGLIEEVGLSDVLTGRVSVGDALQPTVVDRLEVLAAGSVLSDPTGLVKSHVLRSLVAELAQDAYVVLDAPPLLPDPGTSAPRTGATELASAAEGAFVVMSAGATDARELDAALGHLHEVGVRPLGLVVNRVGRRGPIPGPEADEVSRV